MPDRSGRRPPQAPALTETCGLILATLSLSPRPQAVAAARHLTKETLTAHAAIPEAIDTAELLTSEAVTNAIVHAAQPTKERIRLTLIRDTDRLVVEVQDPSRTLPQPLGPPNELTESGRGLFLISALAQDHGVHLTEDKGKAVWFELPAWPA